MVTKEQIRQYLLGLGMCAVGFTHAGDFEGLENIIADRQSRGYLSGFEKGSLKERCCPRLNRDWARSIVAVAYPYRLHLDTWGTCGDTWGTCGNISGAEKNISSPEGAGSGVSEDISNMGPYGTVSSSTVGEDYHRLIKERLERLAGFISQRVNGFRYEIMVDTGPLVDREVAYRGGLGWYGKNCSIIVPPFGSAVFLGEMLINLELEPDVPLESRCGNCTLCVDNCPTGALTAPYKLDARRCVSYITQARGIIPREIRDKMGVSLYGCDRCLISCPYNQTNVCHSVEAINVDLAELMGMNHEEFNKKYRNSALGWRGLNVLKRNAAIALGNRGSPSGLFVLEKALKQPSPIVRGHAAWAIGRVGGPKARRLLEKGLIYEGNEYVIEEINSALKKLQI